MPGKYNLVSNRKSIFYKTPIHGSLFIPEGISKGNTDLIVFFHGATQLKTYYRDKVGFLETWATQDRFILLSVENDYGYAKVASREIGFSIGNGILAAAEFTESIFQAGVVNKKRAFTTGFSAGGNVALLSIFKRPDLFAGFGSFHGNFYEPGVYYGESSKEYAETGSIYFEGEDYETNMAALRNHLSDKICFIAVGGKDISRVKTQIADAEKFFKEMFPATNLNVHNYPKEGHTFSRQNWTDFLQMIRR